MRLDRAVGVARDGVGVFQDDVGFLEALFDVALSGLAKVRDVRPRLGEEPRAARILAKVRVNQDRAVPQRLGEVEHRLEFLIDHLHELRRALGDLRIARHDGSDLFPDKPHPVGREDEPVLHVQPEPVREILARNHAHYAGNLLRRGRINTLNERVRVRALDDLRVQQIGTERKIIHVSGGASDLIPPINAVRRTAYNLEPGHTRPPDLPLTASTASMMGL